MCDRIKEWWARHKGEKYSGTTNHCADMVERALIYGIDNGNNKDLRAFEKEKSAWLGRITQHSRPYYVYFWEPGRHGVGHCSLMLNDEFYISFWPKDEYGKAEYLSSASVESTTNTYAGDCKAEGGNPDITLEINLTKDMCDRIKEWWARHKGEMYLGTTNHCADMVERALTYGIGNGHNRFFPVDKHGLTRLPDQ
ncbi:unnamed protein product [Oppiella nova]|uniref:Uncharacterized protein n=1 Tax=Oppiella nova TaxID=334625 RepID=A0A7R9MA44_9ACAR|nr:unnamed protein product [Oppiella nova]CAG2173617.1 unnamed protein product [Oppiella nova]